MTGVERNVLLALTRCNLPLGWDRRFVRDLAERLSADPDATLSKKQRGQLVRIADLRRLELGNELIDALVAGGDLPDRKFLTPLPADCLRLLAAVLAGECPVGILADALDDAGHERAASVRGCELRADRRRDVDDLTGWLHKRARGFFPAHHRGNVWDYWGNRARVHLAKGTLFRFPEEDEAALSLLQHRLGGALGEYTLAKAGMAVAAPG